MRRRTLLTTAPALGLAAALPPAAARAQASDANPLPAAQRFAVGDMTVTALSDGSLRIGPEALMGVDAEGYAELMRAAFRDPETYRSAVNGFAVQRGEDTYLIDAGTGGALGPDLGRLRENLRGAGIAPEDVSVLIATHLHPDHIGGAVEDGAAVFPNAELVVRAEEVAFWQDEGMMSAADESTRTFIQMARDALAAYEGRTTVFDGDVEVVPGIEAVFLPGHTPGHTGYSLTSGDAGLLIWGDIVHVPPVQFARPDVTIGFDVDPAQAAETRMGILDRAQSDRLLVAGMHMTFPGLAHLTRMGEGYQPVAAPFDYAPYG